MAKRLIPTLNRVLVEKILPPSKTTAGILLPESSTKLNSGKVVSVGPGLRSNEGNIIPASVKEGDTVLLPEYGGTQVKLGDKEYILFRDEDILGTLHDGSLNVMSISFGHSINQCPIATAEKAANEKFDDNQPTLAMDRSLMKEVELTKDPLSSHTVRASHNSSYIRADSTSTAATSNSLRLNSRFNQCCYNILR